MRLFLGLIAVLRLAGLMAEAGCLPFGLFGGKSTSQRLNEHLVDSVPSNDLALNIEAARAYLADIKDDEKLRNLALNFIELEQITGENLCSDESLAILDRLTYALRADSYKAFHIPEVRKRLNLLVTNVAIQQLDTCAPQFIEEYMVQVDEQKLNKRFKTLGYLPQGLRMGCTGSTLLKNQNAWLLRQRGIEIRRGGLAAHAAVEYALKKILIEAGVSTFKKIDPKTGKLVKDWNLVVQLVDQKLYQPCREFVETPEAEVVKKLLTTLRVGNIETSKITHLYYDHEKLTGWRMPIEWAMRLDTCERLLNSEKRGTAMIVYGSLLIGLAD